MKIRPVGAELFHAGGRTDMTNLIVAFRSFANAPNMSAPLKPGLKTGSDRIKVTYDSNKSDQSKYKLLY
jgi:hypothetical protein